MEESFYISLSAREAGHDFAQDGYALFLAPGAEANESGGDGSFVADNAALSHLAPTYLKLGFEEHHQLCARGRATECWEDQLQPDEGDVHDDQLRLLGELLQRSGVDALQQHHAGVLPQPPMQQSPAHVDGVNAGGSALEQNVGETTCRSADICTDAAGDRHSEGCQRSGQLGACSAHERRGRHHVERFGCHQPIGPAHCLLPDLDLARQDESLGLAARLGHSRFDESQIQPLSRRSHH